MTVCPKCNGRGTVGYYHIDHFADIECERCHGSGEVSEVEMTNEEYLKSCTTEQLAEEVYKLVWLNNKLFQQIEMEGHDRETDLRIVREWLKQPHTFE